MKRGFAKAGAKTKRNLLTEKEAKRLVDSCKDFREKLLICGLLYTGMRVNEFIHLKRTWINFDEGYIRVPEEERCRCYVCRRRGGKWKVKVPEAARTIPLLPEVYKIFREYFKEHESIMEVISNQPTAWRIVKRVSNRAGLNKRIFPHVLRGTYASILAGKGFGALDIQSALGWKSIKTADEYIRISPDRLLKRFKEKW